MALSLVFGLKQFIKTKTELFAFFVVGQLDQFSISCFLFKILNQNELHKGLKMYSKRHFFTIESLKTNQNISIMRHEVNFNLITLSQMNYKVYTKIFRLILLLSGNVNLNPGLI